MSLAACEPVSTGSGFLRSSIAYLDCAGREIGSGGFLAFSQPGSTISQLILTAITLFIAWQGIRMMFGRMPDMGDAVIAVAKIGLVLMLATSWPAVKTVFAVPAFNGPAELVTETRMNGAISLDDRLQRVDDGIFVLTKWGTGKLDIQAPRTADGKLAATEFSGVALTDNLALGLGRLCFLVGALMSIGLLKLLSGVMISALPLFAGLLLFDLTRSLFLGWVRILFAMFVLGLAIPLVLTTELSLLEPWLARAISERSAYFATPAAPTELLAVTGSFLLILSATTLLIVKACMAADIAVIASRSGNWRKADMPEQVRQQASQHLTNPGRAQEPSRAESLAWTLTRASSAPPGISISGSLGTGAWRALNDIGSQRDRDGQGGIRRRTKQRAALSHAKRNQR